MTVAYHVFDFDGTLAEPVSAVLPRPHSMTFEDAKVAMDPAHLAHDVPRRKVVNIALEAALSAKCYMMVLTGRAEWSRHITEAWLASHFLFPAKLAMRPLGSNEEAWKTKLPTLDELAQKVKQGDSVTIYDDDDKVLREARARGLQAVDAKELG